MVTDEQVAATVERLKASRVAQGLPATVDDEATLALVIAIVQADRDGRRDRP